MCNGEMLIMCRKQRAAVFAVVILVLVAFAAAETTRKEMRFKVGRRASVSIVNAVRADFRQTGSGQAGGGDRDFVFRQS